ncbi:MAG: glycosyltransferase family 2 protein [Nitrospirae bacterium]|nr:glycosyltransferase family 2 protein [Nitrospirota bacterium]
MLIAKIMPKYPLVSVIMPLYNKQPYVKRAVDSVISQTFPDWELIVVDDGSTDGSSNEIPHDEPRIRFHRQENAGPGAARNSGISMARGEYVTFLDADDYYYPHKLEQEMKLLHEEKLAEWMASAYDYESRGKVTFKSFRDIEGNEIKNGKQVVFDEAPSQLSISGWHISGFCIKRKLLDQIRGFRESMRWMEITDFQIRSALIQPRVLIFTSPLFRVVDVPESASKIMSHRIEGMRQMGDSLYVLSKEYSSYSNILQRKSREQFLSYVSEMILSGKNNEARQFLIKQYPYKYDRKWYKMWIGSWMPKWLLKRVVRTNHQIFE